MSYFPRTSAEINVAEMRQQLPANQQLEQLREQAKQALLNVSLNRKKLYDIVVDLKEHFHEYGFKSPAAAVENVIPRSKSWANKFCAEIEAELEIGEVANLVATETDKTENKEQKSLSKVEKAREEPEKPRVKTADEVIAENGHVEPVRPQARTENGRPKNQLAIWKEIEESLFGRALNRVDELNRQCPNSKFHGEIISWTKNCMRILEAWRESVK